MHRPLTTVRRALVVIRSRHRAVPSPSGTGRHRRHRRHRGQGGEGGQTTAEYALVLLGAAGVALLLLGWATQSGAIGQLFDVVMSGVIGKVK